MSGIRQRYIVGAFLAINLLLCAASAAAASYAGRPIVDVLAELRGPGLDFIYSSELLPRSLTVSVEPESSNRLLIAREILAARGLTLTVVRPGLFAVTSRTNAAPDRLIRGSVVSAADGRAVANASVRLSPIQAVDWTNREGRFAIGPVPEGSYKLRVEADGYQTAEISGVAAGEASADTEVRLAPATAELGEIVVATSRYALDRFGSSGAVQVAGDTLAAQPALGEDAIRALGRLPGMAQGGLTAQANIRGGEGGELLTLLDGFPLREAFHLPAYHDVFGVLDPELLGEAEIYTGGFPVRYGNRMAGVFDLNTIDARDAPHSALGLSVFNAMARNGGVLESAGLDWLAMARVGTLKPFVKIFAEDAGDPSYSDVYARGGYGEPERIRVTANLLWSRDELAISREPEGERANLESRSRYLWLRADHDWQNGIDASIHLGHSTIDGFRDGTIDNPDISTGLVNDRRSSEYWDLRGQVAWEVSPRNWLEGGFEWTEEDAVYRYTAEASFTDVGRRSLRARYRVLPGDVPHSKPRTLCALRLAPLADPGSTRIRDRHSRAKDNYDRAHRRGLALRPAHQSPLAVPAGNQFSRSLGALPSDRRSTRAEGGRRAHRLPRTAALRSVNRRSRSPVGQRTRASLRSVPQTAVRSTTAFRESP